VDPFLAVQEREELSKGRAKGIQIHGVQDLATVPAAKVAVVTILRVTTSSRSMSVAPHRKWMNSSTIPLCLRTVRRLYFVAGEAVIATLKK